MSNSTHAFCTHAIHTLLHTHQILSKCTNVYDYVHIHAQNCMHMHNDYHKGKILIIHPKLEATKLLTQQQITNIHDIEIMLPDPMGLQVVSNLSVGILA